MQVTATQGSSQAVGGGGFRRPSAADWTARLATTEGQNFLKVVADKTGMSTSDIEQKLERGTDLRDILESRGVSRSDFRAALEAAGIGPQQGPGGAPPAGGPPPGPPPGDADQVKNNVLSAISEKLGISQSGLEQELDSGESLSSLAASRGVSQDDLIASILQAIQGYSSYDTTGTSNNQASIPALRVNEAA